MKAFPKDVTVESMSERHIGIESELGVTTGASRDSYDDLPVPAAEAIIRRGILQSIGRDGGGREFRTVPISIKSLYQVRGNKYLREYFEILNSNTKVQSRGGTHIHISILDSDHPNMESNATFISMAFFRQFQKIAGRDSHWARSFSEREGCPTLPDVRRMFDCHRCGNSRVYWLKGAILSPTGHQTLEFRGPKGSNNADEVLAWIEFLNNVVKVANQDSVDGVKFSQLLEGDRISAYANKLKLGRRITKEELEATVDCSASY